MKQPRGKIVKCMTTCKYFFGRVVRERRSYPVILLLYVLSCAIGPFINIVMPRYIIEELMGECDIYQIALYVLGTVTGNYCFAILIRVLQEMRNKQEDWFGRHFDLMMSKKSMEMRFEYTEKESAMNAEKKAETGMSWYSGGVKGLSDCVAGILSAVLTLFGVVYIVVKISPWLLLAAFIAVCVNAVCTSKINQASQEVFEKTPAINKFYYYIYIKITEREYAKELRLYDGVELIEHKALDNARTLNEMDNECAKKQFSWGIPGTIASAFSYGFSYCYLGGMAIRGTITIAEFVMCITAIETFANGCLLPAITNLQHLVLKCSFMEAFIQYMNLEDTDEKGEDLIKPDEFREITFHHVSFRYPGTDLYTLQDINLKIHKGERLSIVGLNGAGKSTLVKLICRLYDVTEGEICMNGKNINDYSYDEYIKILSVVFQDFKLFGYTLDENICLGDTVSGAEKNLQEIYEISGIDGWVNELKNQGDTLLRKEFDPQGAEPSGGQAQKIAIARALYRDAPVIILDEPTAALDPVAEYEIYNRFHELVRNKTAIYISHRLSSCKFCDRIVVLGDKKIQETGSHDELMKRDGLYARMFRTQAKWYGEVF